MMGDSPYHPRMSKKSLKPSPGSAAADAAGVRVLAAQWEEAWNGHDAASLAGLVEDDVDFVTVSGRWLQGRLEFHDWHRLIHETHLSASLWFNRAFRARRLGAGLSLVHLEWTIDNENRPDRTVPTTRSGIFSWIVRCQDRGARILAAHNTNLADATSHRLWKGPIRPEGDA